MGIPYTRKTLESRVTLEKLGRRQNQEGLEKSIRGFRHSGVSPSFPDYFVARKSIYRDPGTMFVSSYGFYTRNY